MFRSKLFRSCWCPLNIFAWFLRIKANGLFIDRKHDVLSSRYKPILRLKSTGIIAHCSTEGKNEGISIKGWPSFAENSATCPPLTYMEQHDYLSIETVNAPTWVLGILPNLPRTPPLVWPLLFLTQFFSRNNTSNGRSTFYIWSHLKKKKSSFYNGFYIL